MVFGVLADGPCGFREVIHFLGRGNNSFMEFQQNNYQEIQKRREFYKRDPAIYKLEEVDVSLIMRNPTLFTAPQPLRNRLWQSLTYNEALDWPQRYEGCFNMMENATKQNSVVVDLTIGKQNSI
ncbi:hypothetical protein VP01_882g4 [Puccinia sorghi]|uniref:Uncharacterized protein n=1 Tax=Puccinia sorghi TaxID=27349 RepID=A0A0L6UAG6_9BASI|nr:hypothetical protein VP01_882g4 [Puccinia sorghi]